MYNYYSVHVCVYLLLYNIIIHYYMYVYPLIGINIIVIIDNTSNQQILWVKVHS